MLVQKTFKGDFPVSSGSSRAGVSSREEGTLEGGTRFREVGSSAWGTCDSGDGGASS